MFGKSGCIRQRAVLFWQNGCIQAKNGCNRVEWLLSDKIWLYSGKGVVFGQSGCIRAEVFVLGQK